MLPDSLIFLTPKVNKACCSYAIDLVVNIFKDSLVELSSTFVGRENCFFSLKLKLYVGSGYYMIERYAFTIG